ncbi:hypothetical protein XELAEV_18047899mg [Xenopus laevis]|nr:hypothetical protein XELAEV_18047899mg [Xenopus laevis]
MLIVTWPCGTILNASIIAVYLSDWKKGVKLGECDWISLSMGCNNLFLQSVITFGLAFLPFGLYLPFAPKVSIAFGTVLCFSVTLSFWLTAGLSICYCLRLVNLSHTIFIQLKRRLSCTLTLFLLWSVAISFIVTIPMNWTSGTPTDHNTTTMYHPISNSVIFMILNAVFGVFLPSMTTFICILLSLTSLLRHIWRMKQNTQFGSPQLKNLISACRTMFLLMALNVLFFLVILSSTLPHYKGQSIWEAVINACIMLNPSGQAIVLIFGNSKLFSAWSKTLIPQG